MTNKGLTFRDIVKDNLNKNWKPTKLTRKEILSERVNETFGDLANNISLVHINDKESKFTLTFGDIEETFNITWRKTDRGWYVMEEIK